MNDRFKFRAWDELNKIMHYDFQFIRDWSNGGWIIFQSDKQKLGWNTSDKFTLNVYPNPYFVEQLKIQQATVLKDTNGKLIYEGDVVLLPDEEDVPYVVNYDIDRAMFVVESQILHLCCNFDNYYGKELEVIGNIYENPELLKECE